VFVSRLTVNFNQLSQSAQRGLNTATQRVQKSLERLSSGSRINSAADDAAGLAISTSLTSSKRVLNQGTRNIADGGSLLAIADSALGELTNITTRLSELSTQASTGALSAAQRKALDTEAQALSKEYTRIVQSTSFNGRTLFNNSFGTLGIAVGQNGSANSSIISGLGGGVGDGTFNASVSYGGPNGSSGNAVFDLNGDGILDIVGIGNAETAMYAYLGNGDGTFRSRVSIAGTGGGNFVVKTGDFNGDGVTDIATADSSDNVVSVYINNGNGTFKSRVSYQTDSYPTSVLVTDIDGDGKTDLISNNEGSNNLSLFKGNGDGTFQTGVTIVVGVTPGDALAADFNGDGKLDLVVPSAGDNRVSLLLGNGDGTFQPRISYAINGNAYFVTAGDINNDGIPDIAVGAYGAEGITVFRGSSTGFQKIGAYTDIAVNNAQFADFNGDGNLDLAGADGFGGTVTLSLGNGDGTFTSSRSFFVAGPGANTYGITFRDLNNDGAIDIVGSDINTSSVNVLLGTRKDGVAPLEKFSLANRYDALQAGEQFKKILDRLSMQRGTVGSFQARLNVAESVGRSTAQSYSEAISRIIDIDVAEETANLTRNKILQEAASALAAQANQNAQVVVRLLQ
jgi:flagellin-like hook-associated protein FlgL